MGLLSPLLQQRKVRRRLQPSGCLLLLLDPADPGTPICVLHHVAGKLPSIPNCLLTIPWACQPSFRSFLGSACRPMKRASSGACLRAAEGPTSSQAKYRLRKDTKTLLQRRRMLQHMYCASCEASQVHRAPRTIIILRLERNNVLSLRNQRNLCGRATGA